MRDNWRDGDFYEELDLLADPDEPRDLFGMVLRAERLERAAAASPCSVADSFRPANHPAGRA